MLEFLSSLFSSHDEEPGRPGRALLEAAVERVVDSTDPRLRGFSNYQSRLIDAVEKSVIYVIDTVDALPVPIEISRRSFGSDPRIHTFFASATHIGEVCDRSNDVSDYQEELSGPLPDQIFTLLTMEMNERTRPGMALQGGRVRRDVMQTVIEFSNHRCIGPSGSETKTRREVKKRAFDLIIQQALERIIAARSERTHLEKQSRLLNQKLQAMKNGNWGLEPMLSHGQGSRPDHAALVEEIAQVEVELDKLDTTPTTIEQSFDYINDVFSHPAAYLGQRKVELNLGPMLVKVENAQGQSVTHLELNEFHISSGESRIVQFGWIPTSELPKKRDFLAEAQRYL
jgi:hypothetical protein